MLRARTSPNHAPGLTSSSYSVHDRRRLMLILSRPATIARSSFQCRSAMADAGMMEQSPSLMAKAAFWHSCKRILTTAVSNLYQLCHGQYRYRSVTTTAAEHTRRVQTPEQLNLQYRRRNPPVLLTALTRDRRWSHHSSEFPIEPAQPQ